VVAYFRENVDTIVNVLNSLWHVLSAHASVVFSLLSATTSILLVGGTAVLNFSLSFLIFISALFYLLAVSGSRYLPVEFVVSLTPQASEASPLVLSFYSSVESAITSVLVTTLKRTVFYGMYTVLTHSLFGLDIVVLPSSLSLARLTSNVHIACLHRRVLALDDMPFTPFSGLKSKPNLGDDEALIRPAIYDLDCFGYQHVLSVLPLNENIFQQLPAQRSGLHPRGFLPRRRMGEGVDAQETVFCTCSQKLEPDIFTATLTVGTQHSLPGSVVYPDVGVKVAKEDHAGHPYLTGLSIAGGLYYFGAEGAFIGPILLCFLLVGVNLYRCFLTSEATNLQSTSPPPTTIFMSHSKPTVLSPLRFSNFVTARRTRRPKVIPRSVSEELFPEASHY
ncbi:unnamed protein product, partial [Schistocephalus solidus]|uniref:SSD domain-containing protein n=1 Tax=Schistocephalus solidus TaxID=70667 RepID=A0A183T9M8_SCHSO